MRAALLLAALRSCCSAQLVPLAVDGVQCLNGATPYVHVQADPQVKDWVLQIGAASVGLNFCIDEDHCKIFAAPGQATPANVTPPSSGPQSPNCTSNPTFCKFNQAQIDSCDYSLFLGDADVNINGTKMQFHGVKLLAGALDALAAAGMASAERVLLTGVGWGGTAAVLNADSIAAQLRALAPALQDFRVLPADGVHPRHANVLYVPDPPFGVDLLTSLLKGNFQMHNTTAALAPGCTALHPAEPWLCMYVNETLPFMSAPVFLVNQLASIWDTQCNIGAIETDNILQLQCIPNLGSRSPFFEWHICFQYTERCKAVQVSEVVAPFQQQYIDDTVATGIMKKPGNGGFFHSCHLGAYWNTNLADGTPVWQHINVGGLSMQQAVTTWYTAPTTATSVFTTDCVWNTTTPGYLCNPACTGLPPYIADN